jgi:hypothetical protein
MFGAYKASLTGHAQRSSAWEVDRLHACRVPGAFSRVVRGLFVRLQATIREDK